MSQKNKKFTEPQPLWAVTSYFNPAGWQRRRHNYDIFRSNLSIPLLTVEFSSGGQFELGPEDADILIQISGGDVMWQKERLLNLGINALPDSAEYVAWLDCDIVFEDDDWWQKAMQKLEQVKVLQPFSQVLHPTAEASEHFCRDFTNNPENILYDNEWSISHALQAGDTPWTIRPDTSLNGCNQARSTPGIAWAAKRETLLQIGLYDRFVLGSGDRIAMSGFLGNYSGLEKFYAGTISPEILNYCYDWAEKAFSAVGGNIGHVPGRLFNLWHGDIKDRRYTARHEILKDHAFDPSMDIRIGPEGAWEWATDKPEMHAAVQRYFVERREDG